MNSRTLVLAALFLVLGGGAWYANAKQKNKHTTMIAPDMDFAVADTANIGKIFIADRKGGTALLEREGEHWRYNDKYTARQTGIQILLETVKYLVVKSIPPEVAVSSIVKDLSAKGVKVEIYDRKNVKIKTYYVGGVTQDERGTFMIMENAEKPYEVHLPAFTGQLRVRYFTNPDDWRDKTVFSEKVDQIQSVSVEYPQQKSQSFVVEKTGTAEFKVNPFYSTTPISKKPQRKGVAEGYLLKYERLMAEAFETENELKDSVKALVPFAIVTVKDTKGSTKKATFWPVEVERNTATGESFVVRYFTELNDGDGFMLTQHHTFGDIFRGYTFFF